MNRGNLLHYTIKNITDDKSKYKSVLYKKRALFKGLITITTVSVEKLSF